MWLLHACWLVRGSEAARLATLTHAGLQHEVGGGGVLPESDLQGGATASVALGRYSGSTSEYELVYACRSYEEPVPLKVDVFGGLSRV